MVIYIVSIHLLTQYIITVACNGLRLFGGGLV